MAAAHTGRDLGALPLPAVTIKGGMQQAQPKTGTVTRILGLLRRKVWVGDGTGRPLSPAEVEAEDDRNLEWTAKEGDSKAEFGHSPASGQGAHGAEEKLRCKWGGNVAPTLRWERTQVTEPGHPGFRRECSGQTSSSCQTLAGSRGDGARQVWRPRPFPRRDDLPERCTPLAGARRPCLPSPPPTSFPGVHRRSASHFIVAP